MAVEKVNEALRVRLQHVRVSRLLDEMDDEFGLVPEHIVAGVAAEALIVGGSTVLTSDPDDLGPLLAGSGVRVLRV